MIKKLRENKILLAILILGILSAAVTCFTRAGMESGNNHAMAVMLDSDIRKLADDYGISYEEYARLLKDEAQIHAVSADGSTEIDERLFLPYEGRVWESGGSGSVIAAGLVEDKDQFTFNPIEGFSPSEGTPMVRVFYLLPYFAARYDVLGYEGPQEIENILYRALTDRNIRVLWLTPFTAEDRVTLKSEPQDYITVMQNLSGRVSSHGISIGDDFSVFDWFEPSPIFVACILCSVAAAGILLLQSVFPLNKRVTLLLLLLAIAACTALAFIMPGFSIDIGAFAASVVFPCLALWLLADWLRALRPGTGTGPAVVSFAMMLIASLVLSMAGGCLIAALQSSTRYLLAIENFRGVKLSQMIPIAYAAYIMLRRLYGGRGFKGIMDGIFGGGSKLYIVAAILLIALAAVYYILRTGDGMVSVSTMEQRIRNWFEYYIIARPRTKEFLIAWPCLAIAAALLCSGFKKYAWPFAILISPGAASVANTFCHSRAPLWLSSVRELIGAGLGLVIGAIAIIILIPLFRYLKKRYA